MMLDARVRLRIGDLSLNVELKADPGQLVVLVGPNGAGKTTLLRALAGLVPVDEGRISIDGRILEDTSAGTSVPTERRPVGVVFQNYLLFPHLSVIENVAFGLRARGIPRGEARQQAARWLERMGLSAKAEVKPRALSGGQAQRVALARALATSPSLLLLDEPLAALDAPARAGVRRDLRRYLAAFDGVRLLVTHDPLEAVALADRIVVIEEGRIVQSGEVADVTARPRSRYVAELVGMNLYKGKATGDTVEIESGGALAAPDAGTGNVFAVVHPHAVSLHRTQPEGSPRNVWEGSVDSYDHEGDRVRVSMHGTPPIVAEITLAAARELSLADAGRMWISVKATDVVIYPA
ncbi:MAG: ABC transporter ATP-binding protein [Actinomycetota bacterium]